MAGVITTGNNPAFLLPGVTKVFGDAYNQLPTMFDKIFETHTSSRAYEERTLMHGLGLATQKNEGSSITYDDMKQQWTQRYKHVTYGTGFIITEEEMEDNQAEEVAAMRAKELKLAHIRRKETVAANILNNGFDSNFTHGDGVELLATNHPTLIGNQSNELSTAADLSEAALEQAHIDIRNMKDQRGNRIAVSPIMLIVPADLEPTASRLLMSNLRPDTANNDINFMNGRIRNGILVDQYLTDTDAWFLKTDISNGLEHHTRREMRVELDNDFDTSNAKFKATARYSFGATDWRGIFGSPGA